MPTSHIHSYRCSIKSVLPTPWRCQRVAGAVPADALGLFTGHSIEAAGFRRIVAFVATLLVLGTAVAGSNPQTTTEIALLHGGSPRSHFRRPTRARLHIEALLTRLPAGCCARRHSVRESHTVADIDAQTLGERIRDARKRADVSQEDLGRAIGLERTAVNKIEGGIRKVTALELSDIAAAIGVRMSTFFEEPVPALVAHRSGQGLDTADSQIDALLATFAYDVEFIASLGVDELGFDTADAVARFDITHPSTNAQAETLAAQARTMMALSPEDPIRELANSVAGIGLLAFSRDVGKDTADAGTVLLRRGGVSLVNSHMRVGRRRLALAHELGHYLIADAYTVDWRVADHPDHAVPLESRLDRFARALLLPQAAVTLQWNERLTRLGERGAAITLASEFRVDMATLATRLRELGLADSEIVASVRKCRTTQADIVELNLNVPLEELAATTVPRPFARAVLRLVRDERISRERALELLQGTFDETDLPPIRQRRPDEIWTFAS
jgi:Zn-dependent peptidase ImmA (M78 family)/transcriptional regulator with XRE-family HTH domain